MRGVFISAVPSLLTFTISETSLILLVSFFLAIGLAVGFPVFAQEATSTGSVASQCEVVIEVVSRDDTKSFLLIEVQEAKAVIAGGCDIIKSGETYQLTGGFFAGPPPQAGTVFSANVKRGSKSLPDGSVKPLLRWDSITPEGSSTALGSMTGGATPFNEAPANVVSKPKPTAPNGQPSFPLATGNDSDAKNENDEEIIQTITRAILDQNLADSVIEVKPDDSETNTYIVTGTRAKKLFYLFPVTVPVEIVFDQAAGTALKISLPWWSKLTA